MVLAVVALITVPDSSAPNLRHWPGWAPRATANNWLEQLITEVPWKQEQIELFGRRHLLPRLTCWMADPGCSYRYSKLENKIESWSPIVTTIRQQIITATGSPFNSLLLNYYRNGTEAMGWHADDEAELDPLAAIAPFSFYKAMPSNIQMEGCITKERGALLFFVHQKKSKGTLAPRCRSLMYLICRW
jgi:alkylated DNA repair dioxygenase AlkB